MSAAEIKESFVMALDSLRANKVRSALTLLGILVGVFSIIVVMTAIRVMQDSVESSLSQLGVNTFRIQKWGASITVGEMEKRDWRRRKDLTYEQAQALIERLTLAQYVGVVEQFWRAEALSEYGMTNPDVLLHGATPGSFPGMNWNIAQGRALLDTDLDRHRRVCVLGAPVAAKLFPFGSAVGQSIKYHGITYTVAGVLEDLGAAFWGEQGNFVLIPLTTGLDRYGRHRRSLDVVVQAPNQVAFEEVQAQARGILRTVRQVPPGGKDDFDFMSNDSLIAQSRSVTLAIRAGAAAVSSIALVVAGIGIMNIMLVSVTERTREIGVRRAVGARRRNILLQFIIESVVLCQTGGVAGVVLGIAGGNLVSVFTELPPSIPLDWALYGVLICSAVGIVFGTYPAYKAACVDPIKALHYE